METVIVVRLLSRALFRYRLIRLQPDFIERNIIIIKPILRKRLLAVANRSSDVKPALPKLVYCPFDVLNKCKI